MIAFLNQWTVCDSGSALDPSAHAQYDRAMEQHWHWEARDQKHNMARSYRLSIGTDLFGWSIVEQEWGRIGSAGRSRRVAFEDPKAAQRHIHAVVSRRASAPRRIGVAYHEVR